MSPSGCLQRDQIGARFQVTLHYRVSGVAPAKCRPIWVSDFAANRAAQVSRTLQGELSLMQTVRNACSAESDTSTAVVITD